MELKKLKTGNTVSSIIKDINDNSTAIEEFNETVITNNGNQIIDGSLTVRKSQVEGSGDLTVQGNLNVAGTTTTKDAETLLIKDNMIVTNSEGETVSSLSGIAIRKNAEETYGIAYDPTDDTVKLGLGKLSLDGEFVFNEGQGLPVAVRQLSETANGNLVVWDEEQHALVDSGVSPGGIGVPDNVVTTDTAQTISGEKKFGDDSLRTNVIRSRTASNHFLLHYSPTTPKLTVGTNLMELQLNSNLPRPKFRTLDTSESVDIALFSDIPDTSLFAKTTYVDEQIDANKVEIIKVGF